MSTGSARRLSFGRPARSGPRWRPLVTRTSGSATEGVYGLILASAVIAVSPANDPLDAGRVALTVLATAGVFWLAHVYANLLGIGASEGRALSRAAVADAMRVHWSLVEVVIPLVLVLGLGAIGILPDQAALTLAAIIALGELAAAGAYAAIRRGASPRATAVSAATALALGLVVVLLEVLLH